MSWLQVKQQLHNTKPMNTHYYIIIILHHRILITHHKYGRSQPTTKSHYTTLLKCAKVWKTLTTHKHMVLKITIPQHNIGITTTVLTCCLTVLVSQRSSCPEMGCISRGVVSDTLLERATEAAAEHTNDVPLGLQASDSILKHPQIYNHALNNIYHHLPLLCWMLK